MKTQRLLIALTVVNMGLLIFLLVSHRVPALANDVAPVVRGRALQIVDDQGRVRASINVLPAILGETKTSARTTFVAHNGGTQGPFGLRASQWKLITAGGGRNAVLKFDARRLV